MSGPGSSRSLRVLVAAAGILMLVAGSVPAFGAASPASVHGSMPPIAVRDASPSGPLTSLTKAPAPGVVQRAVGPNARSAEGPVGSSDARPASTIVNPMIDYAREPAPMGIADYGVSSVGAGARAYTYSSTTFESSARVLSMNTSAATTAFELNAVLVLDLNGTSYSYWIQNGLHVAPASREYTIGGAYVWNFSVAGAHLSSGELQGASGSFFATSDAYVYIPGCNGLPGQCSILPWPSTLEGRVTAGTIGGFPAVEYAYDLGAGWVTYDTVTFLHLGGASVAGFTVDGFHATPSGAGALYDTEWVWVAAGGGTTMTNQGSNLTMALDYWNGENFQAVPTAWNFGSDTGETSSNITESPASPGPGGVLAARVSSGMGALGVLYNSSGRGFLDVASPAVPNGTLTVGGVPTPFVGGGANLTLAAGSYNVALENYTNASSSETVPAGAVTDLNLSGAGRTLFLESGLPLGTPWGVTVGGDSRRTTGDAVAFALANGTYLVRYLPVAGFVEDPSAPGSVAPPVAPIALRWTPFTYEVPVTESGLPGGTAWWVNASGELVQGTASTLDVAVPNGSTPFVAGSLYEFVADPPNGTIDVSQGQFTPLEIAFSYRATFIAGAVTPASADVSIDNISIELSAGTFNAAVRPGNHTLRASAPGYVTTTIPVDATAGNTTNETITLAPLPGSPNSSGGSGSMSGGPPSDWLYAGLGIAAAAAVAGVLIALRRKQADR
jgi:hypothetical protein